VRAPSPSGASGPDETTTKIFLYTLGEAAARFGVELIAWHASSNHYHAVVHDPTSKLPLFLVSAQDNPRSGSPRTGSPQDNPRPGSPIAQRGVACDPSGSMGKAALDITRLSRDEQLDLLDQLWESLGRDPEALPLSDAQRAELDRRLDELEAEGPVGLTWEEVIPQARAR
jgi:putative addiction module component (TIGR02574 family)